MAGKQQSRLIRLSPRESRRSPAFSRSEAVLEGRVFMPPTYDVTAAAGFWTAGR